MERVLRMPTEQRSAVALWAVAAYPSEACGLLLGLRRPGETEVTVARETRNVQVVRSRDRYVIDPTDYLAAEAAATAAGVEIVGVWHTHPDHLARPSETDRELAWEGWSYLIAAVTADGVTEMRSWRLNGEKVFEEEEIRP